MGGVHQVFGWKRTDGEQAFRWPQPADANFVDALAVLPQHAAARFFDKVAVVDLRSAQTLLEEPASVGPFAAGGQLYWGQGSLVRRWAPGRAEAETMTDLGAGYSLHSATVAGDLLLLGAKRESALQVTLNKGLVVTGHLVALGSDGAQRWQSDLLPQGSPLVVGDRLFFPDQGVLILSLCAIDRGTGEMRWKRGFGNAPSDPKKAARQGFALPETPRLSEPILVDGAVVVRVEDGDGRRLLALSPEDGAERWAWDPGIDVLADLQDGGPAFGPPAAWGSAILLGVGTRIQQVKKNGELGWDLEAQGSLHQTPAVDAAGWAAAGRRQLHYFNSTPAP